MVKQIVRVNVLSGIHFRPAGVITESAIKYESKITINKNGSETNVKSFLSLLAACIKCGDEIELACDGSDEQAALEEMIKLFESNFNEK